MSLAIASLLGTALLRQFESNVIERSTFAVFHSSENPMLPATEHWFSGSVLFNHGLVAIVGNKGSGKSALSDTLGLLGATKNMDGFSFLSKKRFRHPSSGYAGFFDATLEWE